VPGQPVLNAGAFFNEDLHECAGFLRVFPRRGALAGRQLYNDVADAARFARLQHHLFGDIVALVDQAQCRHAVLDRGAIVAFDHAAGQCGRAGGLGRFGRRRRFGLAAASRRHDTPDAQGRDRAGRRQDHAHDRMQTQRQSWSGDQAS